MRSLGFLLSRRWILFALVVALLAWAAWLLGEWQFHRLEERKEANAVVERNEHIPPAPVCDVLAPGQAVDEQDQWRVVEATGTYAVEDTVVVRYRTRDGASGVDVVVPLETTEGPSLLVDRGWLATENQGDSSDLEIPPPPAGEVTVTGWVRVDATGDSTSVTDQSPAPSPARRSGRPSIARCTAGSSTSARRTRAPETALEPPELPS